MANFKTYYGKKALEYDYPFYVLGPCVADGNSWAQRVYVRGALVGKLKPEAGPRILSAAECDEGEG